MKRDLYDEEHELFGKSVGAFIERHVTPNKERWSAEGIVDRELFLRGRGGGLPVHGGSGGVRRQRRRGLPIRREVQ